MSQAGILNTVSNNPLPPTIATSYVTDINSPAVPSGNILQIKGATSTDNNANGIETKASPSLSNLLNVQLTNRFTGSGTTIGATTANLFTFALGATPGCFFIRVECTCFDSVTPSGAGYETYTTVRTDGANAHIIGDTDSIVHEDPGLNNTNALIVISGNNVIFQVTGVVGLTIDWTCVGSFIQAN